MIIELCADVIYRGNFADSYGEDFFGLRELGIADELGLSSLTVPKRLLKGKKGEFKQGLVKCVYQPLFMRIFYLIYHICSVEPKEPPPPFPPPPPFVPLDSTKVDDQIGLLRPYYHERIAALATPLRPPPAPAISTNLPGMPPPPNPFNPPPLGIPSIPNNIPGVQPPPAPTNFSGMPPVQFVPPFGPPNLTPPPPQEILQPIVLPDDPPTPAHTKLGPLGQVLKSAPVAGNAAKKKAAPKPKPAVPGSKDPPDGDATPGTPMTAAGTPTATAMDTPKKPKNTTTGTGKKKKTANDGIPTIIMSIASS